jgi:hypothetical protein
MRTSFDQFVLPVHCDSDEERICLARMAAADFATDDAVCCQAETQN